MENKNCNNEFVLIEQLALGDAGAFTRLYNIYQPLLLQYAVKLLKSKQLSEDVCNEVFLELWKNRSQLQQVQSLKPYLFAATKNRTLNTLKSLSRLQSAKASLQQAFPQTSIDAEAALLDKEYVAFIKQGIEQLPRRSKQVFKLCREEGCSYQEVSAQLGISRNAVKNHMVHSVKKLKAFAQKDLGLTSFILAFFSGL